MLFRSGFNTTVGLARVIGARNNEVIIRAYVGRNLFLGRTFRTFAEDLRLMDLSLLLEYRFKRDIEIALLQLPNNRL